MFLKFPEFSLSLKVFTSAGFIKVPLSEQTRCFEIDKVFSYEMFYMSVKFWLLTSFEIN